jgi:hypothetical protein
MGSRASQACEPVGACALGTTDVTREEMRDAEPPHVKTIQEAKAFLETGGVAFASPITTLVRAISARRD